MKNVKPLVFCMDDVPEQKPKRAKTAKGKTTGPTLTSRNFGAFVSVTKIKANSSTLALAWRCRLLGIPGHGSLQQMTLCSNLSTLLDEL